MHFFVGFKQVGAELFGHQPLPGVELEEALDRLVGQIDELAPVAVPADVRDNQVGGFQARLVGRIPQVGDCGQVFQAALGIGEVQG